MDAFKDVALFIMAGALILSVVSAQTADMTVTYLSEKWFPVDQDAVVACQVEHTENRESLSVFWARQLPNSLTFAKIAGYNSFTQDSFIYGNAPEDIRDRFNLTDEAFVGLTAKAMINNITLQDAGTYQCEVEDDKDFMSKATAFAINVYSLPSSVVVTDGDIALSMIPDTTEASAEGETQEVAAAEPIVTCSAEGVFPKPSSVKFLNAIGEVLGEVEEFDTTSDADGLLSFSVPLYLDASKSLDGTTITCELDMVDTIPDQRAEAPSSPISVLYLTENVDFTMTEKVQAGETVSISCEGDGNPKPEVVIVGPNGDSFEGSFLADRGHAGEYTCSVKDTPQISAIATLLVEYLDEPIISGESNIIAADGEYVSSYCSANGVPSPSVSWFGPNGGEVSYDGSLNFAAEKSSGGVYTCVADNGNIQKEVSVDVAVQYGCSATFKSDVSYSKAGDGKGHVELECVATGDPICKVEISGPGCEGVTGSGSATCTIPEMEQQEKAPTYTCTVSNGIGAGTTYTETVDKEPVCCIGAESEVKAGGMPAGGIAAIIIVIALVVVGIPIACYYCRRSSTPSTKNAKAMEAGEDEKLADAENQE